ncbi:MAG TPA: hypothetical protein VF545_01600 [Thermoleophilaceae bacterium]
MALAVAVLALVACGGSDPGPGAQAAAKRDPQQAAIDFARCMREHGVQMADPATGASGRGTDFEFRAPAGGGGTAGPGSEPAFAKAERACGHLLKDAIRAPSKADQERMLSAALRWARCMRSHGVDVPDPQQAGSGTIKLGGPEGPDPAGPTFQRADATCRKLLPGAGAGRGPAKVPAG